MSTGNETDERDPYAPPPEDAPDRPPAAPWNIPGGGGHGNGGNRDGGDGGRGGGGGGPWPPRPDGNDRRPDPRERPDPGDVRVRNGRLALWSGVWAVFFALFLPSDLGLVLGIVLGVAALALGIRTIRGTAPASAGPRVEDGPGGTARTPGHAPSRPGRRPAARRSGPARPTSAVIGLVTGAIAVVYVAGFWGFRLANQDYYDCMDSALTKTGEQQCLDKLPDTFHPLVDGSL